MFCKEIEQKLLNKEIDIAVHSMKDVETKIPGDLVIDCFLKREDPRDAWICPRYGSIENFPNLDFYFVFDLDRVRNRRSHTGCN